MNNVKTTASLQSQDFLKYAQQEGFGELHFKLDPKSGAQMMIGIHSTKLGPSLGGCRFIEYTDSISAIQDVIRLAQGMSYKAALANLPLGGGKAVIIKPKTPYDRKEYMHQFGQFVNELGGRYITAMDSGIELSDMDLIAQYTPFVASQTKYGGDPSPYTAEGVLQGIKAAVFCKLGKQSLKDIHVAIQGLGHVGHLLAMALNKEGAKITIADVRVDSVSQLQNEIPVNVVASHEIHQIPCDVFAPCALGAVLNDITIPQLKTSIIAGAANNQLAAPDHGKLLHEHGILYAPDYVINSGGLIFAAGQYFNTDLEQIKQNLKQIPLSLETIFTRSMQENKATSELADTLAKEKLS